MVIVLTPLADDQYSPFQHFPPGSEKESPRRSILLYEECTQTNTASFKVIKRADSMHTDTNYSNHFSLNSAEASEFTAVSHTQLHVPVSYPVTYVFQFFFFLTVIGCKGKLVEVVTLQVAGGRRRLFLSSSMCLKPLSVTPSSSTL